MLRTTTKLFVFLAASALAARQTPMSQVTRTYGVHHMTPEGPDFGGSGDGPCYDAAKKLLDACLDAAKAAGSVAAGETCRLTYAAQVAECDRQMGN